MALDLKYGQVTVEHEPGTSLNGTDEPVFVLRAQDKLAVQTIARYRNFAAQIEEEESQRSEEFFTVLDNVLEAFTDWQRENADKVKLPD